MNGTSDSSVSNGGCPDRVPPVVFHDNTIRVWTDGSAVTTGDKSGGWAFAIQWKSTLRLFYGSELNTSIGRMELLPVYLGIKQIKGFRYDIEVITDSQYAQKALTVWYPGWKSGGFITTTGNPVKHQDILIPAWERFQQLKRDRSVKGNQFSVRYIWREGHQEDSEDGYHYYNNMCDAAAGEARLEQVTNYTE